MGQSTPYYTLSFESLEVKQQAVSSPNVLETGKGTDPDGIRFFCFVKPTKSLQSHSSEVHMFAGEDIAESSCCYRMFRDSGEVGFVEQEVDAGWAAGCRRVFVLFKLRSEVPQTRVAAKGRAVPSKIGGCSYGEKRRKLQW